MTQPFLSVIVPVYNAMPYLQDCIDSLLQQSFRNLEFIFVNDGSTDDSAALLQRTQELDERVHVIHQENKGVSAARNAALAVMRGVYVSFIDADDWIDKTIYRKIFDVLVSQSVDVVFFDMQSTHNGQVTKDKYTLPENRVMPRAEIVSALYPLLVGENSFYSCCNKVFRSSIVTEASIEFMVGNALSEDNLFNLQFFALAQTAYYLPEWAYFYREVANSATRNFDKHNYFDNVLSVWSIDYVSLLQIPVDKVDYLMGLNNEKLIKSVLSLIYIYINNNTTWSLSKKWKFVKNMVANKAVQQHIAAYNKKNANGKFEKMLVESVRKQHVATLFLLEKYSYLRNK